MAYSKAPITFNGSSNQILIPFGYIRKADIYVGIGEEEPYSPIYNGTELTWLSTNIAVVPGAVLPNGTKGLVYRSTQMIETATLQPSNYDHAALNNALLRQLYLVQEALDHPQGPKGDPGSDGDDGLPGTNGTNGSRWTRGTTAPSNGSGNIGDFYLRTTNGDVYEKTGVSTWTVVTNIVGPAGSGSGDMVKSVYDTDNDGKVNSAVAADSVPWSGVSGKPSTFTPSAHTHPTSEVTGLDAALAAKASTASVAAKADTTYVDAGLATKADDAATTAALAGKAPNAKAVPTGGTTGQVLKKNSNVDNDVGWGSSASGGWQFIEDVVLGADAARITSTVSLSGYKAFRVTLIHALPATNTQKLVQQVSTDNGSTFVNSFNNGSTVGLDSTPSDNSTNAGLITSGGVSNNATTGGVSGTIEYRQINPGTSRLRFHGMLHNHGDGINVLYVESASAYAALTNIAFKFESGNVKAGARFILEGIV
ncbi:hypothetical protein [Aestuariivirga sp.]|uniref:hypothetical protein n=1 Tax=Aestuariivirga sp. TaxID=2650926 RepID=UPI0039E21E2D